MSVLTGAIRSGGGRLGIVWFLPNRWRYSQLYKTVIHVFIKKTKWALAVLYCAVNHELIIQTDVICACLDISIELHFCTNMLTWIDISC